MFHRVPTIAVTSFLLLGSFGARAFSSDSTDINSIAAAVAKDVRDLADPLPDRRAAAELRLYACGSDAFPAIEAAAQYKGLPPAVAATLRQIIQRVQPWNGARQRVARARDAIADWNQRTLLAAYDASGKKNAKWDDAVRAAMSSFARPGAGADATRAAVARATQLGCDDPMVGVMAGRCAEMSPAPDHNRVDDLYKPAVAAMPASRYPADRKFAAYVQYAFHIAQHGVKFDLQGLPPPPDIGGVHSTVMGPQTWDKTAQLLKQASSLWPEVVKQPDIPPAVLKQLANEFIQASTWPKGDRKKAIDQIYPAIEAALPHSTIPLELKGRFYVDYAWEARGGGWAKDVTPANAKLFMERLAVAEQALTKASEMSPNEPDAATVMIEVELGQGRGRDVMEKWFARATKANPDNVDAYRAKLRYLQPKWHGTTAALNAFATECRNTRNWYARLPIVSLEAHDALAEASGNPDAYYRSPSVWRDVEAVLRPWIDAFPDDAAGRSRLAYFACKCQHWDEAKRQFAALGDNAVPDQFGDPAMLPLCRMEAARH